MGIKKEKLEKFWNYFQKTTSVLTLVLMFLVIYSFTASPSRAGESRSTYNGNFPIIGDTIKYPDFRYASQRAIPAVVNIKTTFTYKNIYYDDFFAPFYDFFNFFGGQIPEQTIIGGGSGVIISADGYIITNNHVVQDAKEIMVTLNDNREFKAELIGNDPSTDLAIIKIDANDLPYLEFGNSDKVEIGEWVLAVGNPFNLTSTVTAGIVSAKARNINILESADAVESFIQTDAAVNPGNSGGALVDIYGNLIGINTAIATKTGAFIGYSFAIPSNLAKKVANDLINYGFVQRPYLGVSVTDINAAVAKKYGIDDTKGVLITAVTPNSAAFKAGLNAGDIILKIDGEELNSASRLLEKINEKNIGDWVTIEYKSDNKIKTAKVQLLNKNGDLKPMKKEEISAQSILGATFEKPSPDLMAKLKIDHGMQITDIQSGPLQRAGIKKDFIITEIDHNPINSIEDIENALANRKGAILIEGIYPNGMKAYYAFTI